MKVFKKFGVIFGVIWLAIIFYFAGYLIGHRNFVFERNYKPKLINLELRKPESVDFGLFWKAWDAVTEKYVGDYSPQKLVYGAIKGMMEALGDPYSIFLDQNDQSFLDDLSGKFEGIGAELSITDGKLTVVAPLDESPAEKAGLKAKDVILAIDNKDTANMTLDEAVSAIRGKADTEVKLLVSRTDFPEPKEFIIKREKITISSVKSEMRGDIGYIQITQFGDDTSSKAEKAAKEIISKNPKGIILDLRNNPGGYLDASVDVASLFLDGDKVVVKEKYKDGHIDELKTTLENQFKNIKVIVLVNEGSASASEIVAGALQDWQVATLVGKTTFGKGSVQEVDNLDSNASLKITVAKWLTPKDRQIDGEGIKPDVVVDLSQEDHDVGRDPQLDMALEILNNAR